MLALGFVHGLGADHLMAIAALSLATPLGPARYGRAFWLAVRFAVMRRLVELPICLLTDLTEPERAYAIAAEASAAPGPGGKPLNLAIEVRQVMTCPPEWTPDA